MKIVASFFLLISILVSCKSSIKKPEMEGFRSKKGIVDSLKWLFYAYEFKGTVLFKKDRQSYSFRPTECDVKVDTLLEFSNDSLEVHFSFFKEGYNFSHVYEGVNFYGFLYNNSIATPLSRNIVFDNFNDSQFLKNDNRVTDSIFRQYLKTAEPIEMSNWLLTEAKKRGVL